jgi:hypothetical protein
MPNPSRLSNRIAANGSVYSRSATPSRSAPAIVLSSTSVRFITNFTS